MSNIVERLRSPANVFYEYAADNGALLREAADEITCLRAENKNLRNAGERVVEWWLEDGMKHFNGAPSAMFVLRKALGHKE